MEKKSKSGANVKVGRIIYSLHNSDVVRILQVCSCFSSDFCNFKIWPGGREHIEEEDVDEESAAESEEDSHEEVERRPNGAEWPVGRLKFSAIGFCLLMFFPLALSQIL